jgi:hypothetical protein
LIASGDTFTTDLHRLVDDQRAIHFLGCLHLASAMMWAF